MLVNTELFRTEAREFLKYGYFCPDPPGSMAYMDYWTQQLQYCIDGYSVGGMSITGHHYHYLNFGQIKLTDDINQSENITKHKRGATKKISFPDFWDGDYEYYWLVDIARNGITNDRLLSLNLETSIDPDWLGGDHHMMVAKARRKGFSFKNADISANIFNTVRASKVLQIAHDKKYLYPDGITKMTVDNLNFMNQHTAWFKRRQVVNKQDHVRASYLEYLNGQAIEKGYRSEIQAISMKNNPDAGRGKDANFVVMEEFGAFDNAKDSLMALLPCVENGGIVTGMLIMFGTGGDMEGGTIDFESIFYDPKPYNIMPIENIWDEGASGTYSAFFFPSYKNKVGFIDLDGNSLVSEAKQYDLNQRSEKKKAKDPKTYDKHITENAWNPREAFLQRSGNCYPTGAIMEWRNQLVTSTTMRYMSTAGYLVDTQGKVKFKPSDKVKPISAFPHKKGDDLTGAVVIEYPPFYGPGNVIPDNLYIIVHDPYAQDTGTGSLGVAYVIKRINNFSSPDDCIVASYIGRPESQDEYNYNLFLLARYYNAKIGFENDRGEVIPYAKRFKLLNWLLEESEIFDKSDNTRIRKLGRNYGMSMGSVQRSEQADIYFRDWLLTPRGMNEDGVRRLNLHTIHDIALLEELIKYNNKKGNFDRVSAMKVGMFHLKALHNKEVEYAELEDTSDSLFNRNLF
ncbi:MAG TPA: hypothetical protein DCL77_09090 [Prolixibacteraceae bacterium]|jgi:hypothetical protein|nr:hypothetical protein [Prolixibacteraceae bacterium]